MEQRARDAHRHSAHGEIRELCELATEVGATALAADGQRLAAMIDALEPPRAQLTRRVVARQLLLRLQQHIGEHHRALARTVAENRSRVSLLGLVPETILAAIERRDVATADARRAWNRQLATERTKFLMASRAEALAELCEEIDRVPRAMLHRRSGELAIEIAARYLARFRDGVRPHLARGIARDIEDLTNELHAALARLPETLGPAAFAGVAILSTQLPPTGVPAAAPPSTSGRLADLLRISDRTRARRLACAVLLHLLETRSEQIALELRDEYDLAEMTIRHRYAELAAAGIASARAAADLAREATSAGPDGIAHARATIASWNSKLAQLVLRLD